MSDTLTASLKRGIEFARANNLSVQHIVMRADSLAQLNQECQRVRPDHFLSFEIQLTTRLDAPAWELLLWDEWVDHDGELRSRINANDLPENLQAQQEQTHLEAHPLYGMF